MEVGQVGSIGGSVKVGRFFQRKPIFVTHSLWQSLEVAMKIRVIDCPPLKVFLISTYSSFRFSTQCVTASHLKTIELSLKAEARLCTKWSHRFAVPRVNILYRTRVNNFCPRLKSFVEAFQECGRPITTPCTYFRKRAK